MKSIPSGFVGWFTCLALSISIAACGPDESKAPERVNRVNLSPTPQPGAAGLHGLWLDGCRDVANANGEIVGVVRDGMVLRRDGTFEVHTTYFWARDCDTPELSVIIHGDYRTGGVHLGGKAIGFTVRGTGYMAHSSEGIAFLRDDCPAAGDAIAKGVLISFEQCGGEGPEETFTFHSAFRRVNIPGATEGMLLLGGLDFKPNFSGDASMKYPPVRDALKHVSSRDDILPAMYEP